MSSLKREADWRVPAALSRYLRASVRSTQDVLRYLNRRGVSPSRAARIVTACRARGWLDDRAGARLWADHWVRQGYASAAIRLKLAAKGFDAGVINDVANRCCPSSDDGPRARLVLAQRARHATGRLARVRLARTLASRGFDADLIEQLLNEPLDPST